MSLFSSLSLYIAVYSMSKVLYEKCHSEGNARI